MFFNIFIIMDKKIKNLIDLNVFKGEKILDYDIESIEQHDEETELKFTFKIDHYKLWRSSGYFDPEYYDIIVGVDNGDMDISIEEFLPMIGYDTDYVSYVYEHINKDKVYEVYKPLFNAIRDLGYDYTYSVYKRSPWLNVYVETPNDVNFNQVIETLQDEYGLDTDDIVLLDI
jgi:hypothetical protein